MIEARRLANGNLLVPKRAEGPDGLIGDGAEEVAPGTEEYRRWLPWIKPGEAGERQPDDRG
jgi:hypothetical protein